MTAAHAARNIGGAGNHAPGTDHAAELEKLRFAAEAGQQFLRMLEQQALSRDYRDAFIREYPFPTLTTEQRATLDSDSLSFCDLMASRVPDGRQLAAALRSTRGRHGHRARVANCPAM